MKTSKRIISFVLCAVMVVSTFLSLGPLVSFKAEAAITLGGITQQRVVGADGSYESIYRNYQKRFFNGEETNWPTDFVIPGLGSSDDYTPQGMTYWKAKEWILISAYDASGKNRNSVIYALDVVTTDLVAVFKIQNADGSANLSHGGGIAASEYNFYYADSGSKISYVPLSEMDITGGEKTIKLRDSIDLNKELNGVATSYCCYDECVLWTGNFYISSDDRYNKTFASDYAQTLMGYRLAGNSSAEEWYYLKNGYNLVKLNTDNAATNLTSGAMTYKTYNADGANAEIHGTIKGTGAVVGEITPTFASVNLTEGKKYKIEFIADNNLSDMYMFAPAGNHCNVKQSQASKITNLGDGRYHYQMIFTAGLKPNGADSSWPTTQSTNGSYTGNYSIRFDQDSIPADGRTFNITDFSITEYVEPQGFTPDSKYEGIGCQGNPTYVILLNMDKIQYAMVDKGKIYISRSWSRTDSANHSRDLVIGDIDLTMPGNENRAINGRTRPVHIIKYADCIHFGGDHSSSDAYKNKMLYMGEALCVIDDYLYMFGEGAGWTYNGKEDNKCTEPIDVIWKIDQYAIQEVPRIHEDVASVKYEQVKNLKDINSTDEYIILYESSIKDPVTQDNILYLFNSYGGYNNTKLPKKASASGITAANTGDSRGIIGYEIRDYDIQYDENNNKSIILTEEDDANKSLHWQFETADSFDNDTSKTYSLKLKNRDLYYTKNPYLYVGDTLFAMTTTAKTDMTIKSWGNGDFTLYGSSSNYSIWCNDGSVPASVTAYTNFYSNHSQSGFAPNYHNQTEVPGTFHITNGGQPAMPSDDQQGLHIYKRVTDPYGSTYETNVYTDLKANLQADGTYNITLETYATNNLQYQRAATSKQRPTDFIFVIDSSGLMDKTDAYGYNTSSDWDPLLMGQACGDQGDSFFKDGDHYNTAYSGNYWYKFPDDEYGQIHVAFNRKGSSGYHRDIWLWAEHPISKRCYRLSKFGFMTKGNFSGGADWAQDSAARITDADFLANAATLGWANEAAVIADVKADINRTDYHSNRNSTSARRTYELMHHHYSDAGVTASYYTYGACQRIRGVAQSVDKMIGKIQTEAKSKNMDHRVAIVKYGSNDYAESNIPAWTNTGMYQNNGTYHQSKGYDTISATALQNAFFSADQMLTARNIVNTFTALGHSFPSYGLDMASDIIDSHKSEYGVNGSRSAVVIFISSGVPGYITQAKKDATVTNNTATYAIGTSAYNLKRNSAHLYTILLGDGTDKAGDEVAPSGFSEEDFMKYVSSMYTGAQNMSDPGPLNTRENSDSYYVRAALNSSFNVESIVNTIYTSSAEQSVTSIASLTDKAVLREQISDAFDLTNASYKVYTAKSKYDGIGRLYFAGRTATSAYTASFDNRNIEVTGFDYSAKNVSEYNSDKGLGEKLIVEITGVTADPSKTLTSAPINVKDKTALYETSSSKTALKTFQTYHFAIPEYTYVLDYDLPMLDTDINGTLISASELPNKQTTYVKDLQTDVFGVKFVDGDQNMLYSLNSQEGSAADNSRAYILIQRDDKSYDWFRLNLIPASTVYYEDNKTATLGGTENYGDWAQHGDYTNKYQSISSSSDVYGYEPTYGNSKEKFSLGTYLETSVSSSNNRSETKTFTFKGTGFDLYSACGNNTGIQTVTVKDANKNLVKAYIVDTYYNDAKYGTIYQAPIVHFEGAHGEYTVETTAAYYSFAGALKTQSAGSLEIEGTDIKATSAIADVASTDELFRQIGMDELIGQEVEVIWMDDNSIFNGGTGAETVAGNGNMSITTQGSLDAKAGEKTLVNYIDGFRIYNPLNTDDKDYPASEKGAQYYNLIGNLGSGVITGNELFGYVEGGASGFTFADYSSLTGKGPKNEVYLTPGNNGVSFKMQVNNDNVSAKLSMRAVAGNPKVTVNGNEITVSSTSEQYYDISGAIKGTDTVTIKVSSANANDLVAIGNLRLNNATLVSLANEDLPNVARLMTMSVSPIDYDPTQAYVTPPTTIDDAPADDPNIDPEGSIPTIEEFEEQEFEEDKQTVIEMVYNFFKSIIERIKEIVQSLLVLATKKKQGWIF